jgi:hypothetical protein
MAGAGAEKWALSLVDQDVADAEEKRRSVNVQSIAVVVVVL